MWVLGAIVGALLFSIGGWESAFAGGVIGAAIGAVIGILQSRARDRLLRELKDEVSSLQMRLADVEDRLQRRTPAEEAAAQPRDVMAPPLPVVVAPVQPLPESAVESIAESEPLPAVPPVAEVPPASIGSRPSLIGAALGKAAMPGPARIEREVEHGEPPDATEPTVVDNSGGLGRFARRLLGDNPVVRIGIVVLFFGVAFLLKYAYERVHVPIEYRLVAVALGAIALLVLGFRLRERRPDFGLAAQGGGVGILYLTVFGALKIWSLLPIAAGFLLLVGIAAFSAMLAVLQNAVTLAVVGIAGGFLAPVLASTGEGNHVVLFSYYAVLNVAILGIALYRAWRPLNLLGFVFTFVIGTAWGATRYRPDLFSTTEPFLVAFFLFYVAIPILYAMRRTAEAAERGGRPDYVDGTLVFGLPVVAFGLQAALVRHIEYGAAFSSLALGLFYVTLAVMLWRRRASGMRLLVEAYLAMGVAFGTLAIPLALDGRWTAAAWALEGAALLWVGVRQRRLLARLAGVLLQVLAALALLSDYDAANGAVPFGDAFFLGGVLIGLAGLFSGWWLKHNEETIRSTERVLAPAFIVWGATWLSVAFLHDIDEHVLLRHRVGACLLFASAMAVAASVLGRRWAWPFVSRLGFALLAGMVLALIEDIGNRSIHHPLANLGALGWPVAIVTAIFILRRDEQWAGRAAPIAHAVLAWVVTVLVSWEIGWTVNDLVAGGRVWGLVAWAIVPGIALATIVVACDRVQWPFAAWREGYLLVAAMPIAAFLAAWMLYANLTSTGNPAPLPFMPILNPLDIGLAAALLAIVHWLHGLEAAGLARPRANPALYWGGLGALAFISANGVLLRSLHHWAAVPFAFGPMLASKTVQAAFSIFWTVLALLAMVLATRRSLRAPWIVGATLLGVVVVKLLVVDLSGGVERIVSFIAVGLLMLAIGYLAPLPPRRAV